MKISIPDLISNAGKVISQHSSLILTATAAVGVIASVIVTYKASPKISESIEELKEDICELEESELDEEEYKEQKKTVIIKGVKNIFKYSWPVLLIIALTITSIIASHKINMRRQAALAAAYDISLKALQQYQDKTIEVLGERKEKEMIRDSISEDLVRDNPPVADKIIETGKGTTLFFDPKSGRYFYSSSETITKAEKKLNKKLYSWNFVSLNDFYYEIGLEEIDLGKDIGWDVNKSVIDIDTTAVAKVSPDGQPCLVLYYDVFARLDLRGS